MLNSLSAHTAPLTIASSAPSPEQSSGATWDKPAARNASGASQDSPSTEAARHIGQGLVKVLATPSGKRMRGEPNPLPDEQAHIKKGKTTPPATGPEATRLPNKVQHKELGYALNYSRRLSREEGSRFPIIPLPSATPTERAQSSRQITHYIGDELHNQWLNGLKKVEERTFIEHQLKLAADLDPNNREVARLLEDINHFHELMSPQELLKREA